MASSESSDHQSFESGEAPDRSLAHPKRPTKEQARDAVRTLLAYLGDDPNRQGLQETPDRVIRSFEEIYGGYGAEIAPMMKMFDDGAEGTDEMVVQRNIPFFSMCEHHMLPFMGVAHVGYLPDKRIVGLSKLARLVDVYARRLQVQERMTTQISQALMDYLLPKGAACVIEATHLCMCQRGVSKHHSDTVTSSLRGVFKQAKTRAEFMSFISGESRRPVI
jgi:GTP cyclohydrolase I